jgi:hypothetical protein
MDVENVFLRGDLTKEVSMQPPPSVAAPFWATTQGSGGQISSFLFTTCSVKKIAR